MRKLQNTVYILISAVIMLSACKDNNKGPDPLILLGRAWHAAFVDSHYLSPSLAPDKVPSIVFAANGRFESFTGCNRIAGTARLGKGTITADRRMATAQLNCRDPQQADIETRFLRTFPQATSWSIEDNELNLMDDTGRLIMRLRAAP